MSSRALVPLALLPLAACASVLETDRPSFLADASRLEQLAGGQLVLSGTGGFVYSPALQGRVMVSTVDLSEPGQGFVNWEAIEAEELPAAFHNYGGEDRFWIGPEGSRFSLYFDPGAPMEQEQWRVPPDLNVGAFAEPAFGQLERTITISNRVGTAFTMQVQRGIDAPSLDEVEALVGALPPGTLWTAFRTSNTVTNAGAEAWTREGGLPCIWIAGMFTPGEDAWAILPFRSDRMDPDQGPAVRGEYFGALDERRLRFGDGFALFKTDASYTSKVGVLRNRARDRCGSYDPATGVLTVVQFGPLDEQAPYVDERWVRDGDPFYGDVVNSYCSGGAESFYELESSSPALELAPGESHTHVSLTMHFRFADDEQLAAAVRTVFGLDWAAIEELAGW